ncbi:ATP-binding protein [Aliikangiella sp. G2MR2-5]|uniref:ATP-binding protein n=1 Tax=Aliikangiella sp. G2MR2-5 TaxID=2788943 RepID=UPI0018A9F325|nr:ATP-binding protein [Aliikangiella sp. G2MR2-5]
MKRLNKFVVIATCFIFDLLAITSIAQTAEIVAVERAYSSQSAEKLNEQAYELFKQGQYQKGFSAAIQARSLAEQSNDKKQLARAISNVASTIMYLGDFQQALKLYQESLEISQEIDHTESIESAINNISGVFLRLENPQESLLYLKKLPVLNGIERPDYQKAVAYIGMVSRYIELNEPDLANQYMALLDTLFTHYENPFLNIYYLFTKVDWLIKLQNYADVIELLDRAKELARQNQFEGLEVISLKKAGQFYYQQGDLESATKRANQALKIAQKIQHNTQLLQLNELLFDIDKANEDFHSALIRKEAMETLTDSIQGEKVLLQAEVTRIERGIQETEKQLKESQQLQKIAELKLEAHKQTQVIWGGALLASSALILFWFYRRSTRLQIMRQKRLNEELKRLDKVKDRILTNTSHELRTPLNGIVGLSQILQMENVGQLDSESIEHLKLIEKSGIQLSEVVNDILDLAKLKTHFMTFKPDQFELSQLVLEVIRICKPLLNSPDVEICYQPEGEVLLFHDRARIKQVLFNLIGNSVKFTVQGKITISHMVNNNQLQLIVEDTGIGIPKNMQERVFEGFEQVNAEDNRSHSGSGLGLAICQEIVQALHGKIFLNSELGKGTTIEVHIPLEYNP